jgi:SAM-dependent methyltransferase
MTILCELADQHMTDKGGRSTVYGGHAGDTCHNYTPAYHEILGHRREQVRRVLEVGVNAGSSLRMWAEYFPAAEVIGLDIRPEVLFQTDRIRCYLADQGNAGSLRAAVAAAGGGPFDLIIDDGSHEDAHQMITAETLLPYLAAGGVYVIEDIRIDCRPGIIANQIRAPGFTWSAMECGRGIGKAHCDPACPHCRGETGEQLIVFRRQ